MSRDIIEMVERSSAQELSLDGALARVLETDAAARTAAATTRRAMPPWLRTGLEAVVLLGAGWLFVMPPAWLVPEAPPVAPQVVDSRTVSLDMVSIASAVISRYQSQHVLPASLVELGEVPGRIDYRVTGARAFELRATFGDSTLILPVMAPDSGGINYELELLGRATP